MPMPKQIGVIETMIGIPSPDQPRSYDFMRPLFRDKESIEQFAFPVEYMFKDVPKTGTHEDYIKYTLEQMDRVRHREGGDRRLARQRGDACAR